MIQNKNRGLKYVQLNIFVTKNSVKFQMKIRLKTVLNPGMRLNCYGFFFKIKT